MDEVHDALPRLGLRLVPDTGAARGDPALRRDVGLLGDDEAGAPDGSASVVDEVPVTHDPIRRRILTHGGDDDAVLQAKLPQPIRREHGWRIATVRIPHAPVRLSPPLLHPLHQIGIAEGEVVPGDGLAAGQEAEGEGERMLSHVAAGVLEPALRGPRRLLQLGDGHPARLFVGLEDLRAAGVQNEARECLRAHAHRVRCLLAQLRHDRAHDARNTLREPDTHPHQCKLS